MPFLKHEIIQVFYVSIICNSINFSFSRWHPMMLRKYEWYLFYFSSILSFPGISYNVLIFLDGSGYPYPVWANSWQLHLSSWSTFLGSSCLLLSILIAVQGKWQSTFSIPFFSSELHEITMLCTSAQSYHLEYLLLIEYYLEEMVQERSI